MRLPIYQIDAFASAVFKGNPAAVVPLESWLPDATLQSIAAENNLAETAFFVREDGGWALRWFTPVVEVDLCGHATLATAHLIFSRLAPGLSKARFTTRSGVLEVSKQGDVLALDFPSRPAVRMDDDGSLGKALGRKPAEVWKSGAIPVGVFETAAEVMALKPDMAAIAAMDAFALLVTAPGGDVGVDFVSRFFAPAKGIPEDPVTGSAHCTLIPFWAKRLGRPKLTARQVSARGGELACEDRGERVSIAGRAVLYLEGSIYI
jgi:predicted PhzF superfamily epimerase YddE/YHI9